MIKLGNVSLNSVPRIAVAISDEGANSSVVANHVDILEIRVDQFKSVDVDYVKKNIIERAKIDIPIILTVRNDEAESGRQSDISDKQKLDIFKATISLVDAVDIELKSPLVSEVVSLAKENNKLIIVSSHNFKETPQDEELERILSDAKKQGADIVKMATQANSKEDVKRLMAFTLKHENDNIITISLGSLGSISRLTAPSLGSLITYSYIGVQSAPGQLPLSRLQDDLRLYYPEYNQYMIDKFELLEYI